jgi:hypothetical protein
MRFAVLSLWCLLLFELCLLLFSPSRLLPQNVAAQNIHKKFPCHFFCVSVNLLSALRDEHVLQESEGKLHKQEFKLGKRFRISHKRDLRDHVAGMWGN